MPKYVRDTTGRFAQRPHYEPKELDIECEGIIKAFLKDLYGEVKFPIQTEDLKKLIERDADSLDVYADLSIYGPEVEGLTEFRPGKKPRVCIASALTEDDRRENRLRTTLTHEYGHVKFHAYLWEIEPPGADLFNQQPNLDKIICKRDTMIDAAVTDWMEWQAGYICGALLMPKSAVSRLCREHADAHAIYGPASVHTDAGSQLIQAMVTTFKVSQEAARVRLYKLGFLTAAPQSPALLG